MKIYRNILQVLAFVSILPFIWGLYSMLTGFEVIGRANGGVVILWGLIGFFMSMTAVLLVIKSDKQQELPANTWLYFIFQIQLMIAVLLFIIGLFLLLFLILINASPGFQL